jgi:hypothetical protein
MINWCDYLRRVQDAWIVMRRISHFTHISCVVEICNRPLSVKTLVCGCAVIGGNDFCVSADLFVRRNTCTLILNII